jgi:hypothetical protein
LRRLGGFQRGGLKQQSWCHIASGEVAQMAPLRCQKGVKKGDICSLGCALDEFSKIRRTSLHTFFRQVRNRRRVFREFFPNRDSVRCIASDQEAWLQRPKCAEPPVPHPNRLRT